MELKNRKNTRLRDYDYSSEGDYIEHYTYIDNNPIKWELDELYVK